jgi:hypothetical protein
MENTFMAKSSPPKRSTAKPKKSGKGAEQATAVIKLSAELRNRLLQYQPLWEAASRLAMDCIHAKEHFCRRSADRCRQEFGAQLSLSEITERCSAEIIDLKSENDLADFFLEQPVLDDPACFAEILAGKGLKYLRALAAYQTSIQITAGAKDALCPPVVLSFVGEVWNVVDLTMDASRPTCPPITSIADAIRAVDALVRWLEGRRLVDDPLVEVKRARRKRIRGRSPEPAKHIERAKGWMTDGHNYVSKKEFAKVRFDISVDALDRSIKEAEETEEYQTWLAEFKADPEKFMTPKMCL